MKQYLKDYRKKNRSKLSKQVQKWKDENREEYRKSNREYHATPKGKAMHKARVEKTIRSWMSQKISALKSHAKKPGPHDPKSGPQRDFNIDLDYVMDIWESQSGKCALTRLPMTHQYNDLHAASIDRINSQEGHVRGNIQLVCQCINRMKNNSSNEGISEFLDALVKMKK